MSKAMRMVFLLVIFLIGFGSFSFAHADDSNQVRVISYKVKKGDMLRLISLKHYGTELKAKFLARANGIKKPDLIIEGSVIKIPSISKKAVARPVKFHGIYRVKINSTEVAVAKEEKDVKAAEAVVIVADLPKNVGESSDKKTDASSLVEQKTDEQNQQLKTAPGEKTVGVSDIIPATEDKSKLAQAENEPMSKSALEFTQDDVMSENVPEAKEAQSCIAHDISISEGMEHQLSFNLMSSRNKSDKMTGGMLDYMAWMNTPSLSENFSLGSGVFASAWEDKTSNARVGVIMPGVQLGFKYNRHTDDHMMRMVFGKLMAGRQFRSVRQKSNPTLIPSSDPMLKMMSMENNESVPGDAEMPVDEVMPPDNAMGSDEMSQPMPIKSKNNFRLGSMLGIHYQLNPKSTLELMNENWFSLGKKNDMEMDPAFSLIGSHVLTLGDWSWKLGLGPQYEDWSRTWRLHVVPAEITYREVVTLGVFSDLYPWNKGEMYSGFSTRDLTSIGAVLRFNIGTSMHKGHAIKSE